ncbi:hypothetical protein [Sphaerospermopsis aphanizomenoides]|uniref:hypothetical protein n=1 Tax=Sphaerospermopsis aphanizomenoides TaxID=459663 RepID=UPI001F162F74|nr:hypothetical protein [Sphaerospermopsis aphanizomenoides]
MYLPNQPQPNRKSKARKSPQSGIKPHQPASELGKRYVKYFWHPWNAIIAPANSLHSKPDWKTIHYYLQPSQLWAYHQDKNQLIGIRFNSYTRYATIDIDTTGDYHNLEAYQTIKAALEDIGIVNIVPIQSSYSGGYHLIIPFTSKLPTFNLACALEQTLKDTGFNIRPGHIEIYPNPKPWAKDIITNYKAVRCPMQPKSGAYLLDHHLQPISDSVTTFLDHCDHAAQRQDLTRLRYICKKARKRHIRELYRQKAGIKIEQWQADWEQIIATGWTGYGQTNTLLQIIVGYGIVFLELQNEDLVKYAVETARNAPGYKQYCRHQRYIENRVRDWVKCTEKHQWYTPYASHPKRFKKTFINTFALAIAGDSQTENHQNNVIPFETTKIRNQQRSQQTQERIEEIVKYLYAQNQSEKNTETGLNQKITERGKQISAEYKRRYNRTLSQKTLYKHKHLWHPQWYTPDTREDNSNQTESINPSDSSLNENINSENSKQPENSSNPDPESNYTQFDPKVDIEKKSTTRNPYTEGNYTQLPYMKVLCTPSATSAVGAEVAGVDQLQNQDFQKDSSINQSTEDQQQSENQSIINSVNSAEDNLNQTNEQLENSTNSSVLQSNEFNEISLIQYFLCFLIRSASSKTDKENLSMIGDNELGVSSADSAEETAEHSRYGGDNWQESGSNGNFIQSVVSPETPASNGKNGGEIASVGDIIPLHLVSAEDSNSCKNVQENASKGNLIPNTAEIREPRFYSRDHEQESASKDDFIPDAVKAESLVANDNHELQSGLIDDSTVDEESRIEEIKRITKLRLMAVVNAKKKVREYGVISGRLICGQEREQLEMKFRMQFYLDSGHEVLVAEATAWAEENPGCLPFRY